LKVVFDFTLSVFVVVYSTRGMDNFRVKYVALPTFNNNVKTGNAATQVGKPAASRFVLCW